MTPRFRGTVHTLHYTLHPPPSTLSHKHPKHPGPHAWGALAPAPATLNPQPMGLPNGGGTRYHTVDYSPLLKSHLAQRFDLQATSATILVTLPADFRILERFVVHRVGRPRQVANHKLRLRLLPFKRVSWCTTRCSTALASKVNLPHAINFGALCGANVVT